MLRTVKLTKQQNNNCRNWRNSENVLKTKKNIKTQNNKQNQRLAALLRGSVARIATSRIADLRTAGRHAAYKCAEIRLGHSVPNPPCLDVEFVYVSWLSSEFSQPPLQFIPGMLYGI